MQQAHTVSPVNLNTKPEPAGEEEGDDDEEDEEGESEERKEETPTYNEILTPAQLAQRQMIQDSLQMFQSSLAMRGQAEVGFENQCGPLSLVKSFIVLLRQCLLCHKEPARHIQRPLPGAFCLLLAGSLWHKGLSVHGSHLV